MARILIAEDDPSMRHFLSIALQRAGHEIMACSDGLEAFRMLQIDDEPLDLILADIVMPGMDGIELAQRAAMLRPGIKVLFITGFAAVALKNGAEETAPRNVMAKPFHLKDLVDQVQQMLAA